MAVIDDGPGGGSSTGSTFGQGSLLSGEFFRGAIQPRDTLAGMFQGAEETVDGPLGPLDEAFANSGQGRIFDGMRRGVEFSAGLLTPSREDNVITGPARGVYDTIFDYEGTWGGMPDTRDLWGPSWDPRDMFSRENPTGIDWRNDDTDDPTDPDNSGWLQWLKAHWQKVAVGAVVLYALPALTQLLALGANVTEGS